MSDPIEAAVTAAARQSAWAPALAFVAGVVTSIGPCVAPRFVAVAALASSPGAARWKTVAAFAGGLCASYVVLGLASGFAGRFAQSTGIYTVMSVVLLAAGLKALWSDVREPCRHAAPKPRSLGAACLMGMSFAFVTSPCCTPVVAALASVSAAAAAPFFGAELIGAYAAGHALPLALAGFGWQWAGARFEGRSLSAAMQTVAGALMLALAAYYGTLA